LKSERGKSEREGIRKRKDFLARDLLSSPPPRENNYFFIEDEDER